MGLEDNFKVPEQFKDYVNKMADYQARLNRAVAGGIAPAIQEQANLATSALETAVKCSEEVLRAQSPQEAVDAQTAAAKALGENFQSAARKILEAQQAAGSELQSLMQEGMQSFTPASLKKYMPE